MQRSLAFLMLIFNLDFSKCNPDQKKEFIIVDNLYLKTIPSLAELTFRNFSNNTSNLKDSTKGYYFWQSKVHMVLANHFTWEYNAERNGIMRTLKMVENVDKAESSDSFFKLLQENFYTEKFYITELKRDFDNAQFADSYFFYTEHESPISNKKNPVNICLGEYAKFKSGNNSTSSRIITEHCPNVCNSMPCARIPNAFEYSCQPYINKNKLKSVVLGKPTNIQLENVKRIHPNLFEMITLDFRCECYENHIWLWDYHNNGGSCMPMDSSCDSIKCGVGSCILTKSDYTNSKIAKCLCPPPFTGKYCELRHDPCLNERNGCGTFPCVRDSSNLKYGYYCLCDRGYKMVEKYKNGSLAEPHCEDVNECEGINSPCLNNSTCVNLNSTYKCICLNEEYYGQNCEYKMNEEMLIKWGSWLRWGSCLMSQRDDYLRCSGLQLSFRKCLFKGKYLYDDRRCLGANTRKRKCIYSKCNLHSNHVVSDFLVIFDALN